MKQNNRYDIIFLDIEMKKVNGIETAKEIRCIDKNVIIIYVSGFEAYAIDTFEVNPFRFIVKPVQKKEFEKVFTSAVNIATLEDVYFQYKYGKAFIKKRLKILFILKVIEELLILLPYMESTSFMEN